MLFRPLLFTLLAAENTLFGYDHVQWNIVTLILHLLTVYALFELLLRLAPWPFAELGALFVAVAYAGLELVLWNHLGGYLLGYAFLMLALLAARKVGMEGSAAYRACCPMRVPRVGVFADPCFWPKKHGAPEDGRPVAPISGPLRELGNTPRRLWALSPHL